MFTSNAIITALHRGIVAVLIGLGIVTCMAFVRHAQLPYSEFDGVSHCTTLTNR